MANPVASSQSGVKWRIVSAINAFFRRALRRQAKATGWWSWRDTAPKTVWNFDSDNSRRPN